MKYTLAALFTVLAIGTAHAATFVAEAGDHSMVVYSTATKKEACIVKNAFSYVFDGKREMRTQTCNVNVLPGNHLEVCKVAHSDLNDVKVEKPVEVVSCTEQK